MNRSYTPRESGLGGWDANWDTYNDIPDGGLADTEAAQAVFRVNKTLGSEGMRIDYVDNDNRQRSYIVTWPELIALAHGQDPSNPQINAGYGWRMVNYKGRVFPCYIPQGSPSNPVCVEIEVHEARQAIQSGQAIWQRDQESLRVLRTVRAMTGASGGVR